ncbi:MAG: hypothetical protein ACI38A_06190, partial [Candidatus Ornithomonoglobus sp.]
MDFGDDIFYSTVRILLNVIGAMGMAMSCAQTKYSYSKCAAVLIPYLIWVAAVSTLIMKFFGFLILMRLTFFLISIPAMLIMYYLSEYSPWQAVFYFTLQL